MPQVAVERGQDDENRQPCRTQNESYPMRKTVYYFFSVGLSVL